MSTTISLGNSGSEAVKLPSNHESTNKKIWGDFDNSPHVPFFRPIIDELKKRKYEVVVTARDAYQVRELVEFYGVAAKIRKALWQAQNTKSARNMLACSHPYCTDAEGEAKPRNLSRVTRDANDVQVARNSLRDIDGLRIRCGGSISQTELAHGSQVVSQEPTRHGYRIVKYPGIKEDVYLSKFQPDRTLRKHLGISRRICS